MTAKGAESDTSLQASGKDDAVGSTEWRGTVHSIGISYSGPLPPPHVLREFEDVLPGSAERIFAQFEAEANHRRLSELKIVSSNVLSQTIGTISAAVLGIGGVGGGIWLVSRGQSITGLGTVFLALGSIVATFLYQRKAQDDELADDETQNRRKS